MILNYNMQTLLCYGGTCKISLVLLHLCLHHPPISFPSLQMLAIADAGY